MSPFSIRFDDAVQDQVYDDLERRGIACLENAVSPEEIAAIRTRVDALIDEHGAKYFSLINPWKTMGPPFSELGEDAGFVGLLKALSARGCARAAEQSFELYNVLRVIAGSHSARRAYELHYDATVITALLPVYIPDGAPDKAGDLVAVPNLRRFRRSAALNVAEKAIVQNRLLRPLVKRRYIDPARHVVKLKPGNLYFFWGYRTLHGNLPCEAGATRATLLFHYGDPHAGDRLTGGILRLRKGREKRRLEAAA